MSRLLWLVFVLGAACRQQAPARWSEAWLNVEASRYLDDPAFRRRALVDSLQNPTNTYSAQRLSSYGLQTSGWDSLPEWSPRSEVFGTKAPASPVWNGRRPTNQADWVALGKQVFFRYPLRAEPLVEYAVAHPDVAEKTGVWRAADGRWPGIVSFVDVDGASRLGITCALCHSDVRQGEVVVGAARRAFDYGQLRLAFHRDTQTSVDLQLARRMAGWGPGRADVTEDLDEDPVAIPDLWGLRHQSSLTQAGTIRHHGPAALAIRQETQLLHSNHERVRPPRELAWALAMYLYSLEPPPSTTTVHPLAARGAKLFEAACGECHMSLTRSGPLTSAATLGVDRALADGAARGTGFYRPPSLMRVRDAAPYLHHGALRTLSDLLSPERLSPDFAGGALGPGPVPGHRFGLDWPETDRAAVIAFLESL
jgi:hypothetical protein